jgi:hypothetical protein
VCILLAQHILGVNLPRQLLCVASVKMKVDAPESQSAGAGIDKAHFDSVIALIVENTRRAALQRRPRSGFWWRRRRQRSTSTSSPPTRPEDDRGGHMLVI